MPEKQACRCIDQGQISVNLWKLKVRFERFPIIERFLSVPGYASRLGVYLLTYTKDTRPCSTVVPTYAGECGDGDHSSITRRYASHMATATQPIQEDTVKPVGMDDSHNDLVMLPIEKTKSKEPFLRNV